MEEPQANNLPPTVDLPADLQVPVTPVAGGGGFNVPKPSPLILETKPNGGVTPPIVPEGLPRRPKYRGGSHRWVGWLLGVLGLVLVGATVYWGLSKLDFNRGEIRLAFEPAGVDVMLDQKLQKTGVNSLTIKLTAGSHIVQVTKEGYLDLEREFTLQPGETAEMKLVLDPIPAAELIWTGQTQFPSLINKDQLLAFWDSATGNFMAVDLTVQSNAILFNKTLVNIQKAIWSPDGVATIIKLPGVWQLSNMLDNRRVPGQYIPLGDAPKQAPTYNNGQATWLLDSQRQTATGLQPVLLNENIRDVVFSADGSQIVYFYEAADGERSLIRADVDGREWMRLVTHLTVANPTLQWINDDRHILLVDDGNSPDKLADMLSGQTTEIMPDRIKQTPVMGAPAGERILYVAGSAGEPKLAIWNIVNQTVEQVFTKSVSQFVWRTDASVIVELADRTLWNWDLTGKEKPVKFTSGIGELQPKQLLYSRLLGKLFIIEDSRVIGIKA